ncbi:branched-chain amino acid ABC transporter permease, partial [Azospirillum sp. C340-1]|nr:branched-chain amino acid ABC transporter permease [Azospirillum isscasi]
MAAQIKTNDIKTADTQTTTIALRRPGQDTARNAMILGIGLLIGLAAPYVLYPVFVMKVLCFALFACAFNL